jgi:hypothetical protein
LIDRGLSQPTVRKVLERAALGGRRSESDVSVVEVIREARLERDDELLRRATR